MTRIGRPKMISSGIARRSQESGFDGGKFSAPENHRTYMTRTRTANTTRNALTTSCARREARSVYHPCSAGRSAEPITAIPITE
jgi:hypothetical protein